MGRAAYCSRCQCIQSLDETPEGNQMGLRCRVCEMPVENARATDEKAPVRRPTILCIDDDRLVLGVCTSALEAHGYRAVISTHGLAGIEMAKRERPELILLDFMMPGMDGLDVCRRLRAEPVLKDTPIVILTALPDPALGDQGLEAGATLTLRKPFSPEAIVEAVERLLGRKRGPRTL